MNIDDDIKLKIDIPVSVPLLAREQYEEAWTTGYIRGMESLRDAWRIWSEGDRHTKKCEKHQTHYHFQCICGRTQLRAAARALLDGTQSAKPETMEKK